MGSIYRPGGKTILIQVNVISYTLREELAKKNVKYINLTERSQSMGVEVHLKDGTKYVWNQGGG